MKILLTGGSGFIGKNILESNLTKKYKILAPTHKQLDLTDEDAVTKYFSDNNIDIVIHAAGKPGHRNAIDPTNIFYADMRMFLNIIKNKDKYGKMIVLSSGAIYDQRFNIVKVREEDYLNHLPTDEHALYRYASAVILEHLNNAVELRIFGIFGKYEDYAIRFISNAICKTLFDLPITIKQNRKFDYFYMKDLMPILDYFINHDAVHKTYNITPDFSVDLLSLAERVKEASGKKDLSIIVKQEGMGLEYSGSNFRLKEEIKNLQLTPIDQAIKDLYIWYSEHKNTLKKELLLKDK